MEHHYYFCKKCAFTLSEILITLGIIGVVAVLTMPSLINHFEKKQTIAKLKTSYSILSNAVKASIIDNGEISDWDFSLNEEDFIDKYFAKYLKIINKSSRSIVYYNIGSGVLTGKPYVLSNGMSFFFEKHIDSDQKSYMFQIFVDLNGYKKGKNRLGRDTFAFSVWERYNAFYTGTFASAMKPHINFTKSQLLSTQPYMCNKNSLASGAACIVVIQKDSWTISKDYPWN